MMSHHFYKFEPKTADILFGFVELVLIALLVHRAIGGAWDAALVLAGAAAVLAIVRLTKGPLVGPPLVEVTEDELIIKSFFYLPATTKKNRLGSIKAIRIAGPNGDRRFRLSLFDGSGEEFRPYYGRLLEPKVIRFSKTALPKDIPLVEEEPPGLLSQIHGDF